MPETKVNSSLFSKFKKTQVNSIQKLPDITGLTIDKFHVDSRLDIVSGEADIYLCSRLNDKSGKSFLLKYYRRENAVKPDVIEKLKTVTSPCVAPIEGFGEYEGHQYVVRPYYEMSALSELLAEGTSFSEEELKKLIIPSIIEGLKAVHDAGILHKDLKPANLIPDDAGERIVLIDFGISSDAGKNTFVVTQTGMTLAYAAPEAMQGIFHKETDYYALGITVFELFTGFTPFQNPGLSPEEAARLASISKIEFPDNFPEDIKKLVLGLTYKDVSHRNEKDNPNRRWGYDEVRRWLNGEDVPVPGESVGAVNTAGAIPVVFHPYRFCGKTYTSETELLRTMLRRPEDALKDLGRGFLSHHYYAFSEKKGKLCRDAEAKLGNDASKNLSLMVALIYRLSPAIRDIPYNGGILGSIQDLGRVFIDAGLREAAENGSLRGKNTALTQPVRDFVLSGIPEDYAAIVLKNTGISHLIEDFRKLWNQKNRLDSDTELALILGYSICDERRIPVHGKVYESPEAFFREMKDLSQKDRKAYTELTRAAKTDLDYLEKNLPDAASREFICKAREDSKWAVFGDNEYHFKNGEDFGNYIDKLVREEKPYEIRSLLNRYGTSLKKVSENVWDTDSLKKLHNTVSGFIRVGEYLFTGENAFRGFLTEVLKQGRKDPAFLLNFVRSHRGSLDSVANVFPGIREIVTSLYTTSDAVIVFDEHIFKDKVELQNFVNSTLSRSKQNPWYLSGFMKRHEHTIRDLEQRNELKTLLKPLNDAFQNLIPFDNRIFATVSEFDAHIDKIITIGKADHGYLVSYDAKHSRELTELGERDVRLQPSIKKFFRARNKLVSLDEYLFPSHETFRIFADHVLKTGQDDPRYLKRFVSEHKKSLTKLSNARDKNISIPAKYLLDAGNNVIEFDEYAFADVAEFTDFTMELTAKKSKKPLRGADFVREHKPSLENFKSLDTLAPVVRELEATADPWEKGEAIMVNSIRYAPVLTKGEYIDFGNYPQKNESDKEPIEWLILEVKDNEAFIVSRYGLDCKRYNEKIECFSLTWKECDLRKWLNNDFMKVAFSEEDLLRIKQSDVVNDKNPEHGTLGGPKTKDLVFCLSWQEACCYFKNDDERRCQPTPLAKMHGAGLDDGHCCWWWLRSPGLSERVPARVTANGRLFSWAGYLSYDCIAVRPALWLKL